MPNKNVIIAAAAILILLIAGGAYLKLGKSTKNQTETANTKVFPTTTVNKPSATSLLSLLTSGGNTKCTFEVAQTTGGSTKGNVYISGNKMYSSFATTDKAGKTTKMSMLRLADENYVWGDTLPQGVKMKLSVDDLKSNASAGQYVNVNQEANYKCSPWTPDESIFKVPTNIKFMDISALMVKPSGSATGTTTGGSSPCNSITNPQAKAACESALNK